LIAFSSPAIDKIPLWPPSISVIHPPQLHFVVDLADFSGSAKALSAILVAAGISCVLNAVVSFTIFTMSSSTRPFVEQNLSWRRAATRFLRSSSVNISGAKTGAAAASGMRELAVGVLGEGGLAAVISASDSAMPQAFSVFDATLAKDFPPGNELVTLDAPTVERMEILLAPFKYSTVAAILSTIYLSFVGYAIHSALSAPPVIRFKITRVLFDENNPEFVTIDWSVSNRGQPIYIYKNLVLTIYFNGKSIRSNDTPILIFTGRLAANPRGGSPYEDLKTEHLLQEKSDRDGWAARNVVNNNISGFIGRIIKPVAR
jgi:hypothetical protein